MKDLKTKVREIREWYKAQLTGNIRLFKGEDNEMTEDNICLKLNHYKQLENNLRQEVLKKSNEQQIHRAYYYNVLCWPLEKIQKRAQWFESKDSAQAA